jgi:uncharacterized protein YacL
MTAMRRRTGGNPPPTSLVEVLRLFCVVFFAGLGYELGKLVGDTGGERVLGPFNGTALGIIIGSGIGYVVGGALGRSMAATAGRTEAALREVRADTLVAGAFGAVAGVLLGAGIGWPLFLVPSVLISAPLFGLVLAILGYTGFQVGSAKRDEVLSLVGARSGVPPRPMAAALRPAVVDSSVAIDGRILDVVRTGFLGGPMIVPQPVLDELQLLADAADPQRRARGRRGLETLEALRREPTVDLTVEPDRHPDVDTTDAKLVRLSLDRGFALLTLDTNLAKAASVSGVAVLNLHMLSLALRPPVVAGEDISVQLIKAGREAGQAVGYLDDGTMVVVADARDRVGSDVTVRISSVVVTANGRLVFGDLVDASRLAQVAAGRPRRGNGSRVGPGSAP